MRVSMVSLLLGLEVKDTEVALVVLAVHGTVRHGRAHG